MNCATRRLDARAVIPESGKLSDKERSLFRLAKRQCRALQALDERVLLERREITDKKMSSNQKFIDLSKELIAGVEARDGLLMQQKWMP